MALIYKKVARKKPGASDPPKYYISPQSIIRAKEREVAELMCLDNTLNRKEAEMAIHQFIQALLRLLRDGKTVQFGEFATFSITIKSEGADTEEDCTVDRVKRIVPHVKFNAEFMEALQHVEFVPATKFSNDGN